MNGSDSDGAQPHPQKDISAPPRTQRMQPVLGAIHLSSHLPGCTCTVPVLWSRPLPPGGWLPGSAHYLIQLLSNLAIVAASVGLR
jgi:hypothetical protein